MAGGARIDAVLRSALERHGNVAGVSVGLIEDYAVRGVSAGYARVSTEELLSPHHYLEAASLSKTVATAFAIEYFRKRGVDFATASVNSLLEAAMSPWRVTLPPSLSANERHWSDWPSKVTLAMLVNHTALGMHYVYGIPLDVCQQVLHPSLQLLDGTHEEAYGYKPLFLEREPGSTFAYSGGGFITLQHLIECTEGGKKTIEEITRPWLDAVGLRDFTFSNTSNYCAFGHLTRRKEVPGPGGRLAFPAFAAGALCTPAALARFLSLLARAYQGKEDSPAWLSSETAKLMLGDSSLQDKGAVDFMRAKVGLGVFVATARDNKFILHQAANEGFRGVYLVCFDGPDQGNGFVLLCNGDNPATLFQCDVCRQLLGPSVFNFSGISFEGLADIASFDMAGLKQETIVNLGLKELVLAGFSSPSSSSTSSSRISSKL